LGATPQLHRRVPATSPRILPQGLSRSGDDYIFAFRAMAAPCEVKIETDDVAVAQVAGDAVCGEALRVEFKYSRYRSGSMLSRLNASAGREVRVDDETANLLDFAAQCHAISDGLFDITSGVLRRAWSFDGSDHVPDALQVTELLPLVGWHKVRWQRPWLMLPTGMELDLGGIGKEYAVDSAITAAKRVASCPALVNFGGDLRVTGPRSGDTKWNVAIESVERSGQPAAMIELGAGALATSGDARRFLMKDGVRYGHILDPRTGRPIAAPPRSVTVAAPTCTEAGMFSTMAILNGRDAERFLEREGIQAWCIR
jgi:thiamine biosynthesis lipoprotein